MASKADNRDGSCKEILTGKLAGKWRVQFTYEDEFYRKQRVSRIFPNRSEAKDFLKDLIRGAKIESAKEKKELTLGGWFDWLAENDWPESLDEKTINNRQGRFNKHVRSTFGNVPLTKIDPLTVRAFYKRLRSDGVGDATVHGIKANLVRVFNQAVSPYGRVPMTHANPFRLTIATPTLSHVLSRDQIITLGYFGSVTRLNSRFRHLRSAGYIAVFETPFFSQNLYVAGRAATRVLREGVEQLLSRRLPSPRFVQHALAVTDTRIALMRQGCSDWRFEPQLRHSFLYGGRTIEIRPDGMVRRDGVMTLLEVDMGHVDPAKFARKLAGYQAFKDSGELPRLWGERTLAVQTITTGPLRRARLARLCPGNSEICFGFLTFNDLSIEVVGGWS